MNAIDQQLTNPGVIDYDKKRHDTQARYQKAVQRARFLSDEQKEQWAFMGYDLNNEQLENAEQLIINKNLGNLRTRHQLEKLKPKK